MAASCCAFNRKGNLSTPFLRRAQSCQYRTVYLVGFGDIILEKLHNFFYFFCLSSETAVHRLLRRLEGVLESLTLNKHLSGSTGVGNNWGVLTWQSGGVNGTWLAGAAFTTVPTYMLPQQLISWLSDSKSGV